MFKYITAIILILLSVSARADGNGERIAACMRANLPPQFLVEDFVLTSRTAGGAEEAISGQIYFTRDTAGGQPGLARAMMRIESPQQLRDSAYLMIETASDKPDGLFVYLPALNRVRRVTSQMADGQLFGTDLTYRDFHQFRNALQGMQAEFLEKQQLDDRLVYRLHLLPAREDDKLYEEVFATIDARTCIPRRLAIHEAGRLRKVFTVPLAGIQSDGDRWYISEFTMHNLQTDTRTTLQVLGFHSDKDLPEKLFNPATFHRSF